MTETIYFGKLSKVAQQEFADHLYKEIHRHMDDIKRGEQELEYIKRGYGITPRNIYIGVWVEVGVDCYTNLPPTPEKLDKIISFVKDNP